MQIAGLNTYVEAVSSCLVYTENRKLTPRGSVR